METRFNIFEILQIAEKVENDGGRLYVQNADRFESADLRNTCYRLADWKGRHARALALKRKLHSKKTGEFGRFDPDDYVLSNPQVMAALAMTAARKARCGRRALTGRENKGDILHSAIQREKDAVAFYNGLKAFAQDPASQLAIETIVAEQLRLIGMLNDAYAEESAYPHKVTA